MGKSFEHRPVSCFGEKISLHIFLLPSIVLVGIKLKDTEVIEWKK